MASGQPKEIHTPEIGDRIRVAMYYDGLWRPLVWIRVGGDGSIYTGVLVGSATEGRIISKPAQNPSTEIRFTEGNPLSTEDFPKGSRVSFKASGVIHIPGERDLSGPCLETLSNTTQLCLYMFIHPRNYSPPSKKLPRDYDVGIQDYPVDESRPMHGALYVGPWVPKSPLVLVKQTKMDVQISMAFGFRDLRKTPNLLLQIVFGHGI
jgi:hypothetical protein